MARSVPSAVWNLAMFFGATLVTNPQPRPWYDEELIPLSLSLPSGEILTPTIANVFHITAVVFLLYDLITLGRRRAKPLCHHGWMTLVVTCSWHLFLTQRGYGNSTFLLYLVLMLVELIGGIAISLMVARRRDPGLRVLEETE